MAVTNKPPIPRAFLSQQATNEAGEKGQVTTEPWNRFFRDLRTDLDNTPRILPNASVSEADLNASVAATTLLTPEQDGLYSFQFYTSVLTAAGVSSSLTPALNWTEGGVAKTHTFTAMTGNTTTTNASESYLVKADGDAPIRYVLTYASNAASAMHYAFYAVLASVAS